MTNASERARALVSEWGLATIAARAAVDALKSDPDLLVDLALEVRGLEPFADCGHCAGREDCKYDDSAMLNFDVECEPVYCRKGKT